MSETVERFHNYYGMSNTINNLYNNTNRYNNLFRLVIKENNLKLAIKRLSLSGGKDIPGPDGMTFKDLKNMDFLQLTNEVNKRLHLKIKPRGRKLKLVNKSSNKVRTLGIVNILDRLTQQCVLNILEPICEGKFYKNSFGYRLNLKPQHCIATFNNSLWATVHQGYDYTVIEGDIQDCFNNIEIDLVLNNLRTEFNIHDKKFLSCIKGLMYIDYGKEKYNGKGIMQGSILGPILCNCLLHKLDKYLYSLSEGNEKYSSIIKTGRRHYKNKSYEDFRKQYGNCFSIRYVRFADDFLIGCPYKEDAEIILELVKNYLKDELGLILNENKTKITTLSKFGTTSIDFIGYKVKTTNGHIRISPSNFKRTCKVIKKKIRRSIFKLKSNKNTNIHELNSILSGYINTYDICSNLEPLISFINKKLYNEGYIKQRVLNKVPRKDIYETKLSKKNRTSQINLYDLRRNTNCSYKDYIKIPYWKPNSDNEFAWLNMKKSYRDTFKNIYLHGLLVKHPKDFITDKPFSQTCYIDIHHKIPVSQGGTDEFSNLIPLSNYSHKLVHCKRKNIKSIIIPGIKFSLIKLNKLRKLSGNEPINANDLK
jgi:group II intron reverse transcriptase/maturase